MINDSWAKKVKRPFCAAVRQLMTRPRQLPLRGDGKAAAKRQISRLLIDDHDCGRSHGFLLGITIEITRHTFILPVFNGAYKCGQSVAKVWPKCGQGVAKLWPRPYKKLPLRTSCLAIVHR